jgi:hypothetical protein
MGPAVSWAEYEGVVGHGDWKITNMAASGMHVGASVYVPVSLHRGLGVEIGAAYSQRGGISDFHSEDPRMFAVSGARWSLSYLAVPALARFSFGSGLVRPYLLAGAELDILLTAEAMRGPFNTAASADFALDAGGGIEVDTRPVPVFLQVLYSHGLTDVLEEDSDLLDVELRNRALMVTLGMRLGFGGCRTAERCPRDGSH